MKKVHLTRLGYEKLVEELESLKRVKRPEISKAIEHARSLGDLRENAEYHSAKEAMAHNEARIRDLEDKLTRVEIIDDAVIDPNRAYIGATVKLLDLESNTELEYTLVSVDESDPVSGLISVDSPVGKALLGHAVGDEITITAPLSDFHYRIVKITR